MSRFTGPLDIRQHTSDWRDWQLLKALPYEAWFEGSEAWIVVEAGFVTDGASVPRLFWWLFPATGRYFRAAVVHDRLYRLLKAGAPHTNARTRAAADRELRRAARACGTSAVVAAILWAAVRSWGWVGLRNSKPFIGLTVDLAPVP